MMSKLVVLCIVVGIFLATYTADAVRLKIALPQDDRFHREYQAHRMKRQTQTSCEDAIELAREDLTLVGRLNELNERVTFYRSQHAKEGLEFLQTRVVPGLGGQTVRDVLDVLRKGECYSFIIGGSVRDQFLGRTPRDVDVEIDCELQDIIDICVQTWGQHNCRNSPGSPVGHIGNSSIPGPGQGEDDLDYAPTIALFYVPLTLLEYTVNMMAYDTNGNDFILDLSGTGRIDVCNRHVRIPSGDDSVESWDAWRIDSDGDTDYKLLYRAWKLREKDFQFFNDDMRDYIVRFATEGIENEAAKFYDFYCDEVFDSDYDKEGNTCLVSEELCEGGFENKFDYDRAFAEDFGDFWTDTLESSLPSHSCDMCQLPVDPGPCRAAFPRYVFNSTSGKCEMFTYGGCDGNQNNFETMEACKSSCNPNDCPPYCTVEYCSARTTRRSLCTIPIKDGECNTDCRMTFCHACYYSDEVRDNPMCNACQHNPQANVKCFRRWAVCTRRANHAKFGNPRNRDRRQEKFKCYEHPCRS